MRKAKGMFTIEAAILVPLITLIIVALFQKSIELYQEVETTARDAETVAELNTMNYFQLGAQAESIAGSVLNGIKNSISGGD